MTNTQALTLGTPEIITYEWSWSTLDESAPTAPAIERGRDIDHNLSRVTSIKASRVDGELRVEVYGHRLTRIGNLDRRHTTSALCWATEDLTSAIAAAIQKTTT